MVIFHGNFLAGSSAVATAGGLLPGEMHSSNNLAGLVLFNIFDLSGDCTGDSTGDPLVDLIGDLSATRIENNSIILWNRMMWNVIN